MADQVPFKSDYDKGSLTTSQAGEGVRRLSLTERSITSSQTELAGPGVVPIVGSLVDTQRYGIGKPRRVVIRGMISRE